jgi:hypothetical protein
MPPRALPADKEDTVKQELRQAIATARQLLTRAADNAMAGLETPLTLNEIGAIRILEQHATPRHQRKSKPFRGHVGDTTSI